jgi:hypothetical protein
MHTYPFTFTIHDIKDGDLVIFDTVARLATCRVSYQSKRPILLSLIEQEGLPCLAISKPD